MSNHLEDYLKLSESIHNTKRNELEIIKSNSSSKIDKADRSATLYDFIKMVSRLVKLTIKNVEFIADEGKVITLDSMKKFKHPVITYKILNRKPKGELKPRIREQIVEQLENEDDNRLGNIFGQKFKCIVQFNIIASEYDKAEEVMEELEQLITLYTGFFKKNGVAEILFDEHTTDTHYDYLRETLSVRNLKYYVEIEKLTVIFKEKIREIEILAQKEEV